MTTRDLVSDYLQSLIAQGQERLPIDEEARQILRSWMLAARGKSPSAPRPLPLAAPSPAAQPNSPAAQPNSPAAQQIPSPEPSQQSPAPAISIMSAAELEAATKVSPVTEQDEEVFYRLPSGDNQTRWDYFERALPHWDPIKSLTSLRSKAIWGVGNREADIMFVGDAPNYQDELAGQPFMGEAGKKLNEMLKAMGLTRDDIYLTHLLKFRPSMPRQTTNNRPPNAREIQISAALLDAEIDLVRPRVIVALGVIAARGVLKMGALPLAEYQSSARKRDHIDVAITQHPSFLLRSASRAERRLVWEEMLRVMELAKMPISEKQRGYFAPKS